MFRYLIFLSLIIFSCTQKHEKIKENAKISTNDSVQKIGIDSTRNIIYTNFKVLFKAKNKHLFPYRELTNINKKNSFFFNSDYRIEYIGFDRKWFKYPSKEIADSLGYQFSYIVYVNNQKNLVLDSIRDDIRVSVEIDTTQLMNHEYIDKYRGYPIYIKNTSNQWTKKRVSINFPMVCEALDSNGKWKEIEAFIPTFCGNGYETFIMKPQSYLVSALPLYNGNFETKIRLKHKINKEVGYSNEITTKIFREQFKLPSPIKNPHGKLIYEHNKIFKE